MTITDKLNAIRARLTEAINEAKEREVKMNRHLGYADDHRKGSLVVTLRWDDAETLLESKSPNELPTTLCEQREAGR